METNRNSVDLWYVTTPKGERVLTERYKDFDGDPWIYTPLSPPRYDYVSADITDPAPGAVIDTRGVDARTDNGGYSAVGMRHLRDISRVVGARIREGQEPDEPPGIGACVRDVHGERWSADWEEWRCLTSGRVARSWAEIERPITVLWDGKAEG